jgi:hypothetical protein
MPYGYSPAEFDYIDNEEDDNPAAGGGCLILFFLAPLYLLVRLLSR